MDEKHTDLSALKIDRDRKQEFARKPRSKRKLLIAASAICFVVGALLILKILFRPIEVQPATVSFTSPAQAIAVLTASGYVVADRKAAVASKGTGRLVYLGVEEGDAVKKGQVIARLEDDDVVAALNRARENLRAEEADLNEARKALERQKILLERGLVAPADYDTAEARYKRVLASIEAARASVREAEAAVENTRIVAPFDGTVLSKNADVGEIVAPLAGAAGARGAVVTIADMKSLEVEADVSEANITRVFSGQPCEITLDAYPEHHYPGYVDKIVPTADRAKATVMVKIRFKSYDQRVLPEMSAKITFLPKGAEDIATMARPVLTVPASAVATRNGRPVVYRIEDDKAVEVAVVLGRRIGNQMEIRQGLEEGNKVVASVDDRIRAGTRVAVEGAE